MIVAAMWCFAAVLILASGYFQGCEERPLSQGPMAQALRYGQTQNIVSGNGFVVIGGAIDPDREGATNQYRVEADLGEAKRSLSKLKIPEYTPEDYEFFSLSIERYVNGRWRYEYTYLRGNERLTIRQDRGGAVDVHGVEAAEAEKIISGMK